MKLALVAALDGKTGLYFHEEKETPLLPVALDAALAERLWRQAFELSGIEEKAPGKPG